MGEASQLCWQCKLSQMRGMVGKGGRSEQELSMESCRKWCWQARPAGLGAGRRGSLAVEHGREAAACCELG